MISIIEGGSIALVNLNTGSLLIKNSSLTGINTSQRAFSKYSLFFFNDSFAEELQKEFDIQNGIIFDAIYIENNII